MFSDIVLEKLLKMSEYRFTLKNIVLPNKLLANPSEWPKTRIQYCHKHRLNSGFI